MYTIIEPNTCLFNDYTYCPNDCIGEECSYHPNHKNFTSNQLDEQLNFFKEVDNEDKKK